MTVFNDLFADVKQQHDHTYLDTVAGISFYEHGKYGDECSMLFKYNGTFYYSGFYDKPNWYEAEELKYTVRQYA